MKKILKWLCSITGIPRYLLKNNFQELKMMIVRAYKYTPKFRKNLVKLKANPSPSLVFGCGNTRYSDWVNIDCFFARNVDLVMDLRRDLPFNDQSIAYCYSEHFLEHLLPIEAKHHFTEIKRVLKPGGVYRVVVPDTGKFMRKYAEGDMDFFSLAHPWEEFPLDAIYAIVNWGGEHKSIYDFDSLERLGRASGFEKVILSSVNGSLVDFLNIDRSDKHRTAESLYVEMIKANECAH